MLPPSQSSSQPRPAVAARKIINVCSLRHVSLLISRSSPWRDTPVRYTGSNVAKNSKHFGHVWQTITSKTCWWRRMPPSSFSVNASTPARHTTSLSEDLHNIWVLPVTLFSSLSLFLGMWGIYKHTCSCVLPTVLTGGHRQLMQLE